ncbi:MAG TPA: hypothetical protein VI894_01590 [Candidatus Nanoarchaeia archaeon]|nr:hypothetical protein [Candidatus Nanoarchaeia archaeon]
MVSITLSVPEDVRKKMNEFDEVNWSGFIRKCIIQKAEELSWKEEMLKKLQGEKEVIEWSVKLARSSRKGRFEALKKRGLAK